MPIVRDFIFRTDDDYGIQGLMPIWIAEANATTSIAHDMLEHRLVEKGSAVTAELQAIGAILALRVENGAFYSGLPYEQVMANIIFEMLVQMGQGKPLDSAGPSRRLSQDDDWAESVIDRGLSLAFAMIADENNHRGATLYGLAGESQSNDVRAWIRRGYRYTVRRYRRLDRYHLANGLFKKIDKASEAFVRSERLVEGDKVRVSVCPRFGTINFKVNGFPFND